MPISMLKRRTKYKYNTIISSYKNFVNLKGVLNIIAFYLIAIIIMRVVQSIFGKKANLLLHDGIFPYTKYIAISKILTTGFGLIAILLSPLGFKGFDLTTFLIASCSGFFLAINSLCGIKALKSGTMVLSSIFATAGLIVPSLLGVIFFNETISVLQVLFVVVLIVAMCMLAMASKKIYGQFTGKNILYLVGNLMSNGMVMFCQKLFGEIRPKGNVSLFSMLTFAIPAVVLCVALIFMKEKNKQEKPVDFSKQIYLCALFLAIAVFIIQQFVTILTSQMSTILLFAFVNCGATIISALVGAAMYKEKLTVKCSIAVIIGIVALIGLKIFE